jgi:hypothetical protein
LEILQTLEHLLLDLGTLIVQFLGLALQWGVLLAWLAWWLLAVNWKKVWPVLAQGAWAPLVLLVFLTAMVWSRLDPVPCRCLDVMTIANFWWQLFGVTLVVGLTFLCGWVQALLGWEPAEVNLEPPTTSDHAHHEAH